MPKPGDNGWRKVLGLVAVFFLYSLQTLPLDPVSPWLCYHPDVSSFFRDSRKSWCCLDESLVRRLCGALCAVCASSFIAACSLCDYLICLSSLTPQEDRRVLLMVVSPAAECSTHKSRFINEWVKMNTLSSFSTSPNDEVVSCPSFWKIALCVHLVTPVPSQIL